MFEELMDITRRPEPFREYTARELWTDPHTAERMLAFHLDDSVDAASRNGMFVDHSVSWIVSHFDLKPGAKVADFGCGPGLYARRLARAGLDVTGIDFSENSLRHARGSARAEGLDIDYVHADYLSFETDRRFDLILMTKRHISHIRVCGSRPIRHWNCVTIWRMGWRTGLKTLQRKISGMWTI